MKIPIKKYEMDEKLSWEERYKQLDKHHQEETKYLIDRVTELETVIKILETYMTYPLK